MPRSEKRRRLSTLAPGASGRVVCILQGNTDRTDRLTALGVTPGATVTLLQRFPGVVFLCDHTELAVETDVARAIVVEAD